MERFEGCCLCGAVRFELDPPTKWCANCHCSMCRRAHGAPFVTWVGVPAAQFRIVSGSESLENYRSSQEARRSFCRTCGSMLLFQSTRWADEVHVVRAAIPGEIDRKPEAHCFFSDRAPWVTISDELPRLGGPTGVEPL